MPTGRRAHAVVLAATAVLTLFVDQLTKYWIVSNLEPYQSVLNDWPVRLTYVTNTGTAFGLFQGASFVFVLIGLAAVLLIVLYLQFLAFDSTLFRLALGLQLGGAVGNMIDRIRFGHVVDFIDVRFWPVFNIADSAICIGVAILAYLLFFGQPRRHDAPAPLDEQPGRS